MKYNLPNQTDHLEALRRKDKQAFAKLVDQNATPIYRLALKMVSNEQDAEDILQTTFIKAFKNIEGFEGRSKVSTWLYRIAVNESLMLLRKRKHGPRYIDEGLETNNDDFLPKQIVDWCCLPEKELISSETRTHINQAIGLSTRETAKALEISESAVKVRLMRARLQLREELTGFFSEKMFRERP